MSWWFGHTWINGDTDTQCLRCGLIVDAGCEDWPVVCGDDDPMACPGNEVFDSEGNARQGAHHVVAAPHGAECYYCAATVAQMTEAAQAGVS